MKSIQELFIIGKGPSSSHTIGPFRAVNAFREKYPEAVSFEVTLYGSLAATGIGHYTDQVIKDGFAPKPVKIIWQPETVLPFHPNAMKLEAFNSVYKRSSQQIVYSVGGGAIVVEGEASGSKDVYTETSMRQILEQLESSGRPFWEYVYDLEGNNIQTYLLKIWNTMKQAILRGLEDERVLPGKLHLARKASSFHTKSRNSSGLLKHTHSIFSYALAVAEENAAGGVVVTAPTCGAAGVLPSVLYYLMKTHKTSEDKILKALATAGLLGNLVKTNGSISGAEVGCQGEIGTACSMSAGAAAQVLGGTPAQIEYAAEMAMEHHLGLTCDPVAGLVQIPCIERNALAASRAIDCAAYALLSDGKHRISFDEVITTMMQTGRDMMSSYRETSTGGLAKVHPVSG